MLYLVVLKSGEANGASGSAMDEAASIEEDLVDIILHKQDGRVKRPRDQKLYGK